MISKIPLIAHLRLGVQRNIEPDIKTFEERMNEDYIELIGSWNIANSKLNQIEKIACYHGKERYIAPVKEIKIVNGIKKAYLDHDKGKLEPFKHNYGYQLGYPKLGINKFYTDLEENPVNAGNMSG